ncbi:MAG: GtrA family protein [Sneathiellales bacterium]|nr:GtrA family protein [Sneathiellales bacterium]
MTLKKIIEENRQILIFGLVGVLNTGIDIAVFSLLYYELSLSIIEANTIAYFLAATNSFLLNKNWTFSETRKEGKIHRQFILFLILGLCGLALSNLVVYILAIWIPAIAAKLIAVFVSFIWNYLTSRKFVFGKVSSS